MNTNPNQDIEQLLQQYGSDRRQQEEASSTVRSMARRQRRIALTAALACLLAVATLPLWHSPSPATTDNTPIIAQTTAPQALPTAPAPMPLPTPGTTTPLPQHPRTEPSATTFITNEPLPDPTPSPDTVLPNTTSTPDTAPAVLTLPASPAPTEPSLLTQPALPPQPQIPHGTHLAAQVGTSANVSEYVQTAINASLGLDLTLAAATSYDISVGLGINGSLNTTSLLYSQNNLSNGHSLALIGIDESFSSSSSDNQFPLSYNPFPPIFTLYASVPLTFNLYFSGRNKAGWMLSLTPAHTVTPKTKKIYLNPRKLTASIGLSLPDDFCRSISLTFGLLPTFTSGPFQNMHEIGLSIGF